MAAVAAVAAVAVAAAVVAAVAVAAAMAAAAMAAGPWAGPFFEPGDMRRICAKHFPRPPAWMSIFLSDCFLLIFFGFS